MDNFIVWKYETIWIVNFEPCLLHFAPFTAYSCVRTRGPPPPPPPSGQPSLPTGCAAFVSIN